MQFYMVGIKGAGMSALANILVDLGHEVYGVDYNKKYFTEATFRKKIVCENFENYILKDNYFYIIGNAFKLSDITKKIIEGGYNYQHYSMFLETFFKMEKIGISGSHGKTTTTCFAGTILKEYANILIGDGTGLGNKNAKYFLFEACEYQNNFWKYGFDYLVILNIDYDHPDFFKNEGEYLNSFQKAALNSNVLIYNYDDNNLKKIIHSKKFSFGFDLESDLVIQQSDGQLILSFCDEKYVIDFPFYGRHLCYDFAAAFLLSYIVLKDINYVLEKAKGVYLPRRRFQEFVSKDMVLINDYASHPTEINALYNAVNLKYPNKKKIAIFQPHTLSRTKAFLHEFVSILLKFDEAYILPIFSSVREMDADKWMLLNSNSKFIGYDRKIIDDLFEEKDVVIVFMGAGDIDIEFDFFVEKLS